MATGRGAHEFAPVSVEQLTGGRGPTILGQGSVSTCGGAPTVMQGMTEAMERAEKDVTFMEYERGLAGLTKAEAALACLGEALEPSAVARMHFLRGVLSYAKGDKPSAWNEYFRAFGYEPTLEWDENFPPGSKSIFNLARGEAETSERVALSLVPAVSDGSLLVDGKAIPGEGRTVDVLPGSHLVQVLGDQVLTLKIQVEEGASTTLVIPQAVPLDAPGWVADASRQLALSELTESLWTRGWNYYVVAVGGVWSATVGEAGFEVLTAPSDQNSMTLNGVPAGSLVLFAPKGGGTKGRIEVPWEAGEMEATLGIRLVSELALGTLPAVSYDLTVKHRLLGDVTDEFTVAAGVSGRAAVDWKGASNHAALVDAWSGHQQAEHDFEMGGVFRSRAKMGGALAVAGAALAGYGTYRYLGDTARISELDGDYIKAMGAGNDEEMLKVWNNKEAAVSSQRMGLTLTGSGGVLALGGLGFSWLNKKKAGASGGAVDDWNPQEMELAAPEPEPAPEPELEPEPEPEPEPTETVETETVETETVDSAGLVSANTAPPRITHLGGRARRMAASLSGTAWTCRSAGVPTAISATPPNAKWFAPASRSKTAPISSGRVIWATCTSMLAASNRHPRPRGYQGSWIESWPQPTLAPAASSSGTRVMPRLRG